MQLTILDEIKELKSLILNSANHRWFNIKEVCHFTSLSESTIRRAVKKGHLKVSRKTGKLLFKHKDINRWLND